MTLNVYKISWKVHETWIISTFSWRSIMLSKSWRALQSQYWISNMATSRAWFISKSFPLKCGTLGLGSSTSKMASQVLLFSKLPLSSSPNTAKTFTPFLPPLPFTSSTQQTQKRVVQVNACVLSTHSIQQYIKIRKNSRKPKPIKITPHS